MSLKVKERTRTSSISVPSLDIHYSIFVEIAFTDLHLGSWRSYGSDGVRGLRKTEPYLAERSAYARPGEDFGQKVTSPSIAVRASLTFLVFYHPMQS